MNSGRSYRSWEEFEREEIRKHQRMEMAFDEILREFDTDEMYARRKAKEKEKEGLFDAYGEDGDEDEEEYDI